MWGVRPWELKYPQSSPLFSSSFDNSRKNNGQAYFVTFAPRLYNSYNHAHAQGPHMWPSPGPLARLQVLQNSGSQILMLWVKALSAQIAADKIQERKNDRVISGKLWDPSSNLTSGFKEQCCHWGMRESWETGLQGHPVSFDINLSQDKVRRKDSNLKITKRKFKANVFDLSLV